MDYPAPSTPSWADLKDNVPKLTGLEDYHVWRIAILNYAYGKGVHNHLHTHVAEPYRRQVKGQPVDLISAQAEPFGLNLDDNALAIIFAPSVSHIPELKDRDKALAEAVASSGANARLTLEMTKIWDRWARNERLARTIITTSIHQDIYIEVQACYSAYDIMTALKIRFDNSRPERTAELHRHLHQHFVPRGSNSAKHSEHYKAFTRTTSELARLGNAVPDGDKIAIFLGSLPHDVATLLRTQWASIAASVNPATTGPGSHWAMFSAIYLALIDSLRVSEERESGASAAPLKVNSRGSNNSETTPKKADKKPNKDKGKISDKTPKSCTYHPRSTTHSTAECTTGPAKAQRRQEHEQNKTNKDARSAAAAATSGAETGSTSANFGFYNSASGETTHEHTPESKYLIDSGSTHHIVGNRELLSNVQSVPNPVHVELGGTRFSMTLKEKGCLVISDKATGKVVINDVYYTPDTHDNMLSTEALKRAGWFVDLGGMTISKNGVTFRLDNSFSGNRPALTLGAVAAANAPSLLHKLHLRLGHPGRARLIGLIEAEMITGITSDDVKDDNFNISDCEYCLAHRTQALPRPGPSPRGTSATNEYVHADLKEFSTPSLAGNYYWLTFVSDYTGWRHGIPLKTKDIVHGVLRNEIVKLERQANVTVKVVRTDNGTEFSNRHFDGWCHSVGIIHQQSPPYGQALNGVAERFNRYLSEIVRTMLAQSGLGHDYFDEACMYASQLINMTTLMNDGRSAYERYTGRKPNLDRMLPFGHRVYVRYLGKDRRPGTERPRSLPARILTANTAYPGWKVRLDTGETIHVRDVYNFEDNIAVDQVDLGAPLPQYLVDHNDADATDDDDVMDPRITQTINNAAPLPNVVARTERNARPNPFIDPLDMGLPPTVGTLPRHLEEGQRYGEAAAINDKDDYDDIIDSDHQGFFASLEADQVAIGDPTTLTDALHGPERIKWIEAMQNEVDNLNGKGTWSEVIVPSGKKPISTKWVFKRKLNSAGQVIKFKARLVARGFSQIPGVDFEDTFAPVSRLGSLRLLLAHAATHDLELRQLDVEGAYLNGTLEEEVYIGIPRGVETENPNATGFRLHKALYGLKQSGRAWWIELERALQALSFKRCSSEWGLHVRHDPITNTIVYILAYVDDLLIASKTTKEADDIIARLRKEWTLTDLGSPTQMLSLKIVRDRHARTITISSGTYITSLKNRFDLKGMKSGKTTPLPQGSSAVLIPATEDNSLSTNKRTAYQQLVGIVLWLASTTRPDLSFAASALGRVAHAPTIDALDLGKRVLLYALHTRDRALVLGGDKMQNLVVYCDSDFAEDPITRRSTTGYVCMMYGSPITWAARRQGSVAASTTAAEYVALAEAVREILWLRQMLDQLHIKAGLGQPTVVHVDNLSTIRIAEKPVNFPLAKHIDVRYHIVREQISKGNVKVHPVTSANQLADIFTKPLGGPRHRDLCARLQLHDT
jgi:hypothetical protein